MPYPCCCTAAPAMTVDCPACFNTSNPDLPSPLQFQAPVPEIKVYASSTEFGTYSLVQTFPATTALFTNRDHVLGEPEPYNSCCWVMPSQLICAGPRQVNGFEYEMRYGGNVNLFTQSVAGNTKLGVSVFAGIYRRTFRSVSLGGVVSYPPDFHTCGLEPAIGAGDATNVEELVEDCNTVKNNPTALQSALIDLSSSLILFTDCSSQRKYWKVTHGSASMTVTWIP